MITQKQILGIALLLTVIEQDMRALSKPVKVIATLGAALGAVIGGTLVYQKIEKKRIADCLDRLKSYQEYAQDYYADQLELTKNLDCALAVAVLDSIAQSLHDKPVSDYLNALAAEIDVYKNDIRFIKTKKIEEQTVKQIIDKAESLLGLLINLYDHIARERDYFLKHTFSDRQSITRGHEKVERIKCCYRQFLGIIDYNRSLEQLTENELMQLSSAFTECMDCQKEFSLELSSSAETVDQILHFINTQSVQWHQESSLFRQANQHKADYEVLDCQLKFLSAVLSAHGAYFELEQSYKHHVNKYPFAVRLSDREAISADTLHSLILEHYPQSSVLYPYVSFADTIGQDCLMLRQCVEQYKRELSEYPLVKAKIDQLIHGLNRIAKVVVLSPEFQRQKEVQQKDLQARAAIEAQQLLAVNQQEQTILEKEKIKQEAIKLRELQRANELHDEQNILKKRNQELKSALLRECRPQGDLLIELRDLLRKIHEAPQEKLSESQLDMVIKHLKNIQTCFAQAGFSLSA